MSVLAHNAQNRTAHTTPFGAKLHNLLSSDCHCRCQPAALQPLAVANDCSCQAEVAAAHHKVKAFWASQRQLAGAANETDLTAVSSIKLCLSLKTNFGGSVSNMAQNSTHACKAKPNQAAGAAQLTLIVQLLEAARQ